MNDNQFCYGVTIVAQPMSKGPLPFDVEQGLIWRTGDTTVVADVRAEIGMNVEAQPVTSKAAGERAIVAALIGPSRMSLDEVCAMSGWIIDDEWFDACEVVA